MHRQIFFHKTSLAGAYTEIAMTNTSGDTWAASIPAQTVGTTVYYYIEGNAVNGRTTTHPILHLEVITYYSFGYDASTASIEEENPIVFNSIYQIRHLL